MCLMCLMLTKRNSITGWNNSCVYSCLSVSVFFFFRASILTQMNVLSIANGQSLNNKLPCCCFSLILNPPLLHYNLITAGVCQDESVCEHSYPWLPALVLPEQFKATRGHKGGFGRSHTSWLFGLVMIARFTHNACVLFTCSRDANGSGLHWRLCVHQQQDSRQRLHPGAGGRLWFVTSATIQLQCSLLWYNVG